MDSFDLKPFDLTDDQYKLFFAFSPDMLSISGPTHFLKVNPAFERVLGYTSEEMCSQPFTYFLHPEDIATTEAAVAGHIKSEKKIFTFENRYRCKDGATKLILWRSIAADDQMYAVARDITLIRANEIEVLQAREKAEASTKELEFFSHSVAHDLRAPLRSIQSFSAILLEDHAAELNEDAKRTLDRVIGASKKMGILIESLLDLSKVGREIVSRKDIDASALAREICAELQALAPQRKCEFAIQEGLTVKAAPELFKTMLYNLLDNAWKFTSRLEEAAKIEFGTQENKGSILFFVRDNGAGFNMKHYDRLFGIFQRLHSTEDFPGIGIGLATARRIVQRHGGGISARSVLGQGAAFYFTI